MAVINLGNLKFTWKGNWAATTAYAKDDIVRYGASAYVCVTSHISGTTYAANSSKFELMASGIEFGGVYNPSTLYQTNEIVTYGGATYIALQESTGRSPSTSPTYWSNLVGGIQFIGTYSGSTAYTTGDIVTYGGNSYIAISDTSGNLPTNLTYWKLFNQGFSLQDAYSGSIAYKIGQVVTYGANSYIAIQDTVIGTLPTNAVYWTRLTSGQISTGIYSSGTGYKIGDLVQYGGYIYACTAASTGNAPNNTNYWTQATTGFAWYGTYGSGSTYQKGAVVNYNGSSFVSLIFDNIGTTPDSDIQKWALMMQGSANNVYTTKGDIAIRNASAIVRLPVGSTGQVLTVDNSTGLPTWENNGIAGNVYYVSPVGVDATGYGSTLQRPFATIQYATKNVTTPCTIFVKAGSYYEILPITVPANCAIVGDSLRNTFINPKPNVVVTKSYVSSNVAPVTAPTFANGTTAYNTLRTTVVTAIPTIASGVISFLSTTYPSLSYNQVKCKRDVGLIVQAVMSDLVFGSNYQSTKAGIAYLRASAGIVTSNQLTETVAGINKARDLVNGYTANGTIQGLITGYFAIVTSIITNGLSSVPALSFPDPAGVDTNLSKAKTTLIANKAFLQAEIVAWIAANYTIANIVGYNASTCSRDIGYILDAITYDIIYSGNSQIIDSSASYYLEGTNLTANTTVATAAYTRLQTIIQQVILNTSVTASQVIVSQSVSNPSGGFGPAGVASSLVANLIAIGQNGITLTLNNTTNLVNGMTITGTGFSLGQTILAINGSVINISGVPEVTPSGTLTFTQNFYSLDLVQVPNNLSTMFLVSDGSMLKTMTFNGMTGFALSSIDTQDITTATIGGVFVRLNPASPIINKSPYITDCSSFSVGGVGVIVDGSVHATGNKSMVFHAFTNINDLGVGFWMKDNAKAEIVSCFTYYCHFGYATTGGAKIRSLNGNNSYGTYGVVSRGYDTTETPITGTIYGNQLTYFSNSLAGNGFSLNDQILGQQSGAIGQITNVQSGSYKIYYKAQSGTFISGETIRGSSSLTTATIATGGVTGQKGFVLVVTGITSQPIIGTSIEFTGDTSAYVIQQVGTWVNSSSIVNIVLAQEKVTASSDGTALRIRANFSQSRLTGHDFLSIGTGGTATTNYPGYPTQSASPGNQTIEVFPGRVFYISTDQDGNFKVGNYFAVNQATGTATLNANAFNLSGLSALRLGSVGAQLGELISEFSSDVTLGADSNSKVSTQHAVKTYVDNKIISFSPSYLSVGTSPTTRVSLLDSTGTNPGAGAVSDLIRTTIAGTQVSQMSTSKFTYTPGGNTSFEVAQYYMQVPVGNTSNRPGSPLNGYMRYNTDIGAMEIYNGSSWVPAGGLASITVTGATYTASAFQFLYVNTTSNAVTVTLPASPNFGDEIRFLDVAGTFGTNNLILSRNTKKIQRLAENLVISTNGAGFSIVYYDATQGWLLKDR
jgi:hypothetical protein